ncbi:MAG TPA: universal stress protein [Xanthobacteraceae bacterium]|jgi:nucleotide-binding universal stress UspA family protein
MSIRKILIAVDEQPLSVRAAELGAELARALGGEVALIHVNAQGYPGDTGIPPQQLIAEAQGESKRLLAGFRERLSLPSSTLEFVQAGTPTETITRAAADWRADLIVIGSHGRTGVRRALLGSVAEGVMRNAPCPVLVVRAPQS